MAQHARIATSRTGASEPGIVGQIRQDLAAADPVVPGPFGPRRLVYADYTASGRALGFFEAAVARVVAPYYANTHSESSFSGRQTTHLREEARTAIRRAVGADDRHAVIFCGSGATAGVNKLALAMGLRLPLDGRARDLLLAAVPEAERPVVFIGPYEHHSNDLPWRESLASVVRIPLGADGRPSLDELERQLLAHRDRPLRIGAFSAASNVTGVCTDVRALAQTLHRHDALCVLDYAAGAPYLPIDMAETAPGRGDHCDAIVLSPHKFVGGPGASGVLVADRKLFANAVPSQPGGGTVQFVTSATRRYIDDVETREEAGTPAIIGDIRAGMVLQLKQDIGVDTIARAEQQAIHRALSRWRRAPGIEILGPADPERLAIFSFNIRSGEKMLHHGFVVALLNDLFGLQVRGGCSCAGPYGHDLLGIDSARSARYQQMTDSGLGLLKLGWVRLGFNFFFDLAAIDRIIEAVAFVARRGRDLLPLYEPDLHSGVWRAEGKAVPLRFGFDDLRSAWLGGHRPDASATPPSFEASLRQAEELADRARWLQPAPLALPPEADALRWFWLPSEATAAASWNAAPGSMDSVSGDAPTASH